MDLTYYKGNNFGDKLNPFFFYALFDYVTFVESHPDHIVFGLGSILSNAYFNLIPRHFKALPFGSGIRTPEMSVPDMIIPGFVRGPVSAKSMNCESIADTAYIFPFLRDYQTWMERKKRYELSIMPYFRHMGAIQWNRFAQETGIHVIDPTWPVLDVLDAIAASEHIMAGAMHGCILADIFRVPWARLRFKTHESEPLVQDVKWLDWTMSIAIEDYPVLKTRTDNLPGGAGSDLLELEIVRYLADELDLTAFALSSPEVFDGITGKLKQFLHRFSDEYSIPINPYRTVGLV